MAAPVTGRSQGSLYALVMAYVLVLLALWKVDVGLARPSSWYSLGGNMPAAINFSPGSLSNPGTVLSKKSPVAGPIADGAETRRLATVALMLYASQDSLKK
jgi:hypothetical protein